MTDVASRQKQTAVRRDFAVGLARAFGGALLFALPMLMTMEMWWIGFTVDPLRLALLTVLTLPLLVGLAHFVGFEDTFGWRDDLKDAVIAYGVGWIAAAIALALFAVIGTGMPGASILGKIAIQAPPASIGAMLARSQLGTRSEQREEERKKKRMSYGGELFLMAVGALFLAINVAPTEEMVLIGLQMTAWHSLALLALSLAIIHGFVYALEFQGSPSLPPDTPFWSAFLRFTVVGYALALVISLYILWTFGRVGDTGLTTLLQTLVVLGFPAAIGAAAARLIL
jgi:putative integral membrane protein (TIGR02587 family)